MAGAGLELFSSCDIFLAPPLISREEEKGVGKRRGEVGESNSQQDQVVVFFVDVIIHCLISSSSCCWLPCAATGAGVCQECEAGCLQEYKVTALCTWPPWGILSECCVCLSLCQPGEAYGSVAYLLINVWDGRC